MRTSPSRDARAAKLESAEARFRTLFEHAPIGVVIADSDSYYLDANPTACRMFGYSRDEFVGLHARDIVVDADTAAVRPALDEIHRDERHERQWRFRRRDGSTFAADVRATKLADGTLLGLISDVSDRVEVEQALRNEQTFSETMIDSMPGVLYFYDRSGRFLRWSRNFEDVTGYSGDEIARMHPLDFFAGDDRALVEARIGEVFTAGESSVEASFVAKDGTAHPYFFTGRRVVFDGRECLVGVGLDMSARRQAERRLEESERRARALVAQLSEHEAHLLEAQRIARLGSWTFDFATGELICSDQVYAIAGIPPGARTLDALFATTHPDDRGRLRAARRAAVAGTAPLDLEYRLVTTSGTERVVHLRGSVTANADGTPRTLSGTLHDITDRARMAAERERRHQAEAADRIKSAFLATMSHELRTPLNSILGFTGIVLQELAGPLTDEQKRQLGMARASARHLLALVNDVLDISKIEAGQLEIASRPFDLRGLIVRAVESIRPLATDKGLDLQCEIADDLGTLEGDERRVEQVLLNLLSNAVKFTEQGRVTISADVDVAPVSDGREPQPAAVIRVADTGPGIRAEDLSELFQPFRQIDAGMARHHDGTGLGLAISRRLAGLMGGDIRAESDWGRGSTFTLILPMRESS